MMNHRILHLVFTLVLQLLLIMFFCVCCRHLWHPWLVLLTYIHSIGLLPHHASVNESIRRALASGGVLAILEPSGVCHEDPK